MERSSQWIARLPQIENSADRILEILGRVGIKSDVVVTGGVAKNVAIIKELEKKIGFSIIVPPEPQIVGALGAALFARDKAVM